MVVAVNEVDKKLIKQDFSQKISLFFLPLPDMNLQCNSFVQDTFDFLCRLDFLKKNQKVCGTTFEHQYSFVLPFLTGEKRQKLNDF